MGSRNVCRYKEDRPGKSTEHSAHKCNPIPLSCYSVRMEATSCSALSCLQLLITIHTNPPSTEPTAPSMNITLQEKPALIPSTLEAPVTLEGSLQPSQAKTAGM